MKIISWNVNGLRAVERKGFSIWAQNCGADFICLQEIKLQKEQIPEILENLEDYKGIYNFAVKKGYSGTVIYTKQEPIRVVKEMGIERFDSEGRFLQLDYPDFTLINLYMPHGGRQKENLEYKMSCYDCLFKYLSGMSQINVVLVGDFNIAHEDIDLARAKQNRDNIMFTKEERQKHDQLAAFGYIDSFRSLHPEIQVYTWWPWIKTARENNIGWRIDYAYCSKNLHSKLTDASILREISGSDHCPIELCLNV